MRVLQGVGAGHLLRRTDGRGERTLRPVLDRERTIGTECHLLSWAAHTARVFSMLCYGVLVLLVCQLYASYAHIICQELWVHQICALWAPQVYVTKVL
jgi:hypothetical protein